VQGAPLVLVSHQEEFKSSSSSKRKAAGEHLEAPPTKLIHDEQV
jgi:hypothetical protein